MAYSHGGVTHLRRASSKYHPPKLDTPAHATRPSCTAAITNATDARTTAAVPPARWRRPIVRLKARTTRRKSGGGLGGSPPTTYPSSSPEDGRAVAWRRVLRPDAVPGSTRCTPISAEERPPGRRLRPEPTPTAPPAATCTCAAGAAKPDTPGAATVAPVRAAASATAAGFAAPRDALRPRGIGGSGGESLKYWSRRAGQPTTESNTKQILMMRNE